MSRRLGTLTALVLAAAALATVPIAGPAEAAADCLSEPPAGLLQSGCDDTVPPETALTSASTQPNAAGWLAASTMTFTFAGAHTDADADALGFECRLDGPAQPHDWTSCTSPRTYSGLVDSDTAPYTFFVRAVDVADQAFTYRVLGADAEPGEDVDPTPATLTWGQDSTPPVGFVNPDTYDDETPQQPVVVGRTVPIRLNSNEAGAGFECELDGRATPCTPGAWQLTNASSGRHYFRARAVDKAGNPSAWSPTSEFFVPTDLRARRGWTIVKKSGAFDRTLVRSTTKGARLVLPKQRVGELRLYAPTGPAYGAVRVKVGATRWRVVDLSGRRAAQREIVVIDRYRGARTGKIVIEVLSRDKPVLLDAIVARTNVFQG
ncbi:hypothetical protein [Nocardioides currus]|uniref:Ig-like domain-containing protein n=1 Tax=Nocardioides currus TaxID=2133958 RepID=A0A2R7YY42_9ACTN|nr:hypothetical protein [Nocardioides currus]PUA81214.1 hypothetical protein C7S10_09245 [Nocardioides currus]